MLWACNKMRTSHVGSDRWQKLAKHSNPSILNVWTPIGFGFHHWFLKPIILFHSVGPRPQIWREKKIISSISSTLISKAKKCSKGGIWDIF